jgi:thioredoxin reductase (NADPH)
MKFFYRKLISFFIILTLLCLFQIHKDNAVEVEHDETSALIINPQDFPLDTILSEKAIEPVVVIGSGVAGLTAGLFTSRANFKTLVITGNEIGGQLTEASYVENWPAKRKLPGLDIMNDLKEQTMRFGAILLPVEVIHVNLTVWPFEITLSNNDIIKALTVVIATGGYQKTLDIPGVKEFWGKGIGVCSICDAPFDKGKDVAIIGGGDAAADRALQLSAFANKVILLVRGPSMRAAAVVQDYLKNSNNISIRYDIEVKKISGAERVTGLEIVDRKTGKNEQLPVQSVYFALGFVPRSALFKDVLDIDDDGFIKIFDHTQATSKKGVFAAGTVEDPRYQKSVTAAGDGARAGMDAIEFLQRIGFTPAFAAKVESNLYKIPQIQ